MANILFREIYECRSKTLIDYMIEDAQPILNDAAFTKEEREAFDKIYVSNDLDEIHLICAVILGYEEEAESLRWWIKKKGGSK